MQVSKLKLSNKVKTEVFNNLYQVLADLNSTEEIKTFMESFFSKTELTINAKRLTIALFLKQGRAYKKIKQTLKVSSATIASIEKLRHKNKEGFELAFERLEADEWADQWSKKITNTVGKIIKK